MNNSRPCVFASVFALLLPLIRIKAGGVRQAFLPHSEPRGNAAICRAPPGAGDALHRAALPFILLLTPVIIIVSPAEENNFLPPLGKNRIRDLRASLRRI